MRRHVVLDNETFRLRELIPFIGAVTTGAIGGCVACLQHARTKRETMAAYAVSYAVTGAYGGVMALAAFMIFLPDVVSGWPQVLAITGIAGLIVSAAMAAGNLSARFSLPKLNMEVAVDVRRIKGGKDVSDGG